jgi:DNA-binding HxlR family transcriptional regulator
MGFPANFEMVQELCSSLSEGDDAITRELFTCLAGKWSLWVMSVLAEADGPLRFSRVLESAGSISQKSLTKTLRQLERGGLATRKMFMEAPPRVEYTITPLGLQFLQQIEPLWTWVAQNAGQFQAAQQEFAKQLQQPA